MKPSFFSQPNFFLKKKGSVHLLTYVECTCPWFKVTSRFSSVSLRESISRPSMPGVAVDSPRRLGNLLLLRVRPRSSSTGSSSIDSFLANAPVMFSADEEDCEIERKLEGAVFVQGAGDARANGVYLRHGKQNNAARWRHRERPWLCILRDGANWWIGNERAATEDLYWCDASGPEREWRVCPCDDTTHKHFRGSAPAPKLSLCAGNSKTDDFDDEPVLAQAAYAEDDRTLRREDDEDCPICLGQFEEATKTPCGHMACARCLCRARRAMRTRDADMRCPLCRAPFILAGALHVPSGRPLFEALPKLEADVDFLVASLLSSSSSASPRSLLSSRSGSSTIGSPSQRPPRIVQAWHAFTGMGRSRSTASAGRPPASYQHPVDIDSIAFRRAL